MEKFLPRTLHGKAEVEVLARAQLLSYNVLLYGPTGPGKTTIVRRYADETEQSLYTIHCQRAMEPSDAIGRWVPTEDGTLTWKDGPVLKVLREGGVLYIDEINYMPAGIASYLHSLLDARRSVYVLDLEQTFEPAAPILIVAAYNPGYGPELSPALRNRFAIQVEVTYDVDLEERLVPDQPYLHDLARQLRAADEIETPVPTNALVEYATLESIFGTRFAKRNFLDRFPAHERAAVRSYLELTEEE